MWAAISSFLAQVIASIFNAAMNEPGETTIIESKEGIIEVPLPEPKTVIDRYANI